MIKFLLVALLTLNIQTSQLSSQVEQWDYLVEQCAAEFDVDPQIVYAVMQVESFGNPDAIGGSGEVGLMQILPSTAQYIANSTNMDVQTILSNPYANICAGSWLLSLWYHRFQSVDLALSAYNAGARYVIDHGEIHPATAHYVWKVREVLGWNVPSKICIDGKCLVEDVQLGLGFKSVHKLWQNSSYTTVNIDEIHPTRCSDGCNQRPRENSNRDNGSGYKKWDQVAETPPNEFRRQEFTKCNNPGSICLQ